MKALPGIAILIAVIALFMGPTAYGQISFGIQIGRPPDPPVYVGVRPVQPARDYVWVDGYWVPYVNRNYRWFDGYWTVPPYSGARWVAPHYDGRRYHSGYWDGNRGRRYHDYMVNRSDRDRWRGDGRDRRRDDDDRRRR